MAKKTTTSKKSADDGTSPSAGYTVLAWLYRSRDFGEVVGQEPIARTLQAAIEQGRTAHAYLFCGTRGVGKTSMARIFAKALNADAAQTQGAAIAEAVLRGEDLDVIEIDGASNRGINEARDLIAGAGLSPTRGQYKIYIIDEVHMLTREAFNALLKTMEEPPPHVKFILCTTDPQKVPATIQSRCQRFDFRAIPTARIAEHLTAVLEQEGITADEDVVLTVASLGNGSMRDALSLLDRLLAAGQTGLTMEQARDILGLPATEVVDQLVQAVIDSDPAAGLAAGAELIAGGATVETALEMFTDRFRTLMLVAACGAGTELLDLTREARDRAAAQAEHFDAAGLVYMIATCDAVARNARGSATGRALFDAAIVRLCLGQRFGDVAAMVAGGATPTEKKKPEPSRGRPAPVIETTPAAPARGTAASPSPARSNGTAAAPPPSSAAVPAPSAASPAPAASASAAVAHPAPSAAAPATPAPDLETAWDRLLATAEGPIAAVAASVRPVGMQDRMVTLVPLGATPGGSLGFLERRAEGLAAPLGAILGHTVRVRIDPSPAAGGHASAGGGATSADSNPASSADDGREHGREHGGGIRTGSVPSASSADEAARMPLVRAAMEIFDASIAEVRDLPAPSRPASPPAD
jgi:DNA polymerase-3 subunit gamma/tau